MAQGFVATVLFRLILQQILEFQAFDGHLVVEHERQFVLPGQRQLSDDFAGAQVQLDFFAGQVLAFATDDAAVFVGVAQFALVQHIEIVGGFLRGDPLGHHRSRCHFHGERTHGQGADHFAQGRKQVFGAFRAGRVDQDQALFRRDRGKGR